LFTSSIESCLFRPSDRIQNELKKIRQKRISYQNILINLNKQKELIEKEIREIKPKNVLPNFFKSENVNYQLEENKLQSGGFYLGHLPKDTEYTFGCPQGYVGKSDGIFATCSLSKEKLAKQKELEKIKGMLMKYSKKLNELERRERFILNIPNYCKRE